MVVRSKGAAGGAKGATTMKLRTFLAVLPTALMMVFGAGCVSGWLLARSALSGWAMLLGWALLLLIVAGSVRDCARRLWRRLGAEPEALRFVLEAMAQGNLTAVSTLPPPSLARSVCASVHELSQRLHGRVAMARRAAHRLEQALDDTEHAPAAPGAGGEALLQARQALDTLVRAARELHQRADAGCQRAQALAGWGLRYADAAVRLSHEQQLGQRRNARIAEIVAAIESNAMQTHLLALQAAMEAAREGERSRGVQLIGNEVRVLSQRCRYAARQLRELVPAPLSHALPAEGVTGADLPAMAGILQDQLAESADGADQLQRAAAAAVSAAGVLAERLAPLQMQAQENCDRLEPALQEALRIEVEKVCDALSVFYLGIDAPALGSAVAPADAAPPAPVPVRHDVAKAGERQGRVLRADPFLTH
jgi:methyl-accepting chemotaxis protein-1 (serine sensor receptor)